MKKYMLTVLIALSVNIAFAQDFFDALRYSQTELGGSARSISMGGAFGALGGDFVSASINPAGLGLYRSSEFSLSPTLNYNNVSSNYLGNTVSDYKYNFNVNNLSYVVNWKSGIEEEITSFTFGIGYNRLKNFNSNMYIQGDNAKSSLLDYFTSWANDYASKISFDNVTDYNSFLNDEVAPNLYEYEEQLAWNANLLPFDTVSNTYWNDINNAGYGQSQEKTVNKTGRIDEYLLSMGINFNHRFYVGASLGIQDVYYKETYDFSEWDQQDNIDYFNNYLFNQSETTSGWGVNFKLGAIWRPVKSLRLGAAIHTPTFYSLDMEYDSYINSQDDNMNEVESWPLNLGLSSFKLETPVKIIVSGAYSIMDKALVSIDYEYMNYSTSKLRNQDNENGDFIDVNSDINDYMLATGNLHIGAEYRVTPNFSVRSGYIMYGNPWVKQLDNLSFTSSEDVSNSVSFGFGYRHQRSFVDFAYRINNYKYAHEVHYSFDNNGYNIADIKEMNQQATITFGFRF